jgi:hypothetical protein
MFGSLARLWCCTPAATLANGSSGAAPAAAAGMLVCARIARHAMLIRAIRPGWLEVPTRDTTSVVLLRYGQVGWHIFAFMIQTAVVLHK